MRPLECLIIPELAVLQNALEGMGYPDALQEELEKYDYHGDSRGLESTRYHPASYINMLFIWEETTRGKQFWKTLYERLIASF